MKTLLFALALLGLGAVAYAQGIAFIDGSQLVTEPPTLAWQEFAVPTANGQTRETRRLCASEDGSCASTPYPVESLEQSILVNRTPGRNVAMRLRQLVPPGAPDTRNITAYDLITSTSSAQVKLYGPNYQWPSYGLGGPLANQMVLWSQHGMVIASNGLIRMAPGGTHVATYGPKGFGFGGYNDGAQNAMTLGWGQCSSAPNHGEVTACAMPGPGGVYHLYAVLSNGAMRCLTC
jgi:hypothetical protein